ncbi:unnamed protein product [Dibothriocephalus latus]|uniref:Uncharacterized protein n=1 Tax=Dibothriocephalus latus TaxID=60516 RepID=A0A3P7LY51_DIBLA|nr:unnamed protein product [Dibothriocephalus latus]
MTDGLRLRTLHWEFGGSLEPPRVVSMRTEEAIGKDNIFAQVTVRFLTQQVCLLPSPSFIYANLILSVL